MTSQPGKQTITVHQLHDGNQTLKFGQFIKYYLKNIFLKNHAQNVVEKLVPDLFKKI